MICIYITNKNPYLLHFRFIKPPGNRYTDASSSSSIIHVWTSCRWQKTGLQIKSSSYSLTKGARCQRLPMSPTVTTGTLSVQRVREGFMRCVVTGQTVTRELRKDRWNRRWGEEDHGLTSQVVYTPQQLKKVQNLTVVNTSINSVTTLPESGGQ